MPSKAVITVEERGIHRRGGCITSKGRRGIMPMGGEGAGRGLERGFVRL